MAIPAATTNQRFGFKTGLLTGLGLAAAGGFLFIPAAKTLTYALFLIALFTLASGLSILETSANPLVIAMGAESTSTRRLNLAQAFNPIGANLGVLMGAVLIREPSGYLATDTELVTGSPAPGVTSKNVEYGVRTRRREHHDRPRPVPKPSHIKLVEPACERQRAGRVETIMRPSGILWSGVLFGCRVVSTRAARPSRPSSTSYTHNSGAGSLSRSGPEREKSRGQWVVAQSRPGQLTSACSEVSGVRMMAGRAVRVGITTTAPRVAGEIPNSESRKRLRKLRMLMTQCCAGRSHASNTRL